MSFSRHPLDDPGTRPGLKASDAVSCVTRPCISLSVRILSWWDSAEQFSAPCHAGRSHSDLLGWLVRLQCPRWLTHMVFQLRAQMRLSAGTSLWSARCIAAGFQKEASSEQTFKKARGNQSSYNLALVVSDVTSIIFCWSSKSPPQREGTVH